MTVLETYDIPGEGLRLEMLRLESGNFGFHLYRQERGEWVRRAEFDAGEYGDRAAAEVAAAKLVPGFSEVLFGMRMRGDA